MTSNALIFGSIDSLVDTSELELRAHNDVFARFDLDWNWSHDTMASLRPLPSRMARIDEYGFRSGDLLSHHVLVDLHDEVQQTYAEAISHAGVARTGVRELIESARSAGWAIALVTPESREIATATTEVSGIYVDHVIDDVQPSVNSQTRMQICFDTIGVRPADAIVVVESLQSRDAVVSTGAPVVVFPGEKDRRDVEISGVAAVVGDRIPTVEGLARLLGRHQVGVS